MVGLEGKLKKIIQRLLVFFIGIPVVLAVVYFDVYSHLPLNIAVVVFAFLASKELYNILSHNNKDCVQNKYLVLFLSTITSIAALILAILNEKWVSHSTYIFVLTILFSFSYEIFTAKEFGFSNIRLANSVFIIFYCGFLITYITRMSVIENSTQFIFLFLLMVFLCDSLAWLFGMLFGKNNRGYVKASPNKSIIGFAGGILGSILIGIVAKYFYPQVFFGSTLKVVALGFLMAISGICGDLIESVIKRSGETKDSGDLILGRGGVLDSIDSLIFSAPVYYIACHFLYGI